MDNVENSTSVSIHLQ